jgi:hypothetical protein
MDAIITVGVGRITGTKRWCIYIKENGVPIWQDEIPAASKQEAIRTCQQLFKHLCAESDGTEVAKQ